jgi:hypothetical protein
MEDNIPAFITSVQCINEIPVFREVRSHIQKALSFTAFRFGEDTNPQIKMGYDIVNGIYVIFVIALAVLVLKI